VLAIDDIRTLLAQGRYELTRHAFRRVVERNISAELIGMAGASVEVIEDYPDDKYSASCLLLGYSGETPLHLHVSRGYTSSVRIITLYIPSSDEWLPGFRQRRPIE
jgi:hypothetical protein